MGIVPVVRWLWPDDDHHGVARMGRGRQDHIDLDREEGRLCHHTRRRRRRCRGAEQGERVLAEGGETGEDDKQREQHGRHADGTPAHASARRELRPQVAHLNLARRGQLRLLVHRASRLTRSHASACTPLAACQDTTGASAASS